MSCAVAFISRACLDCGHPSYTYARCGDCREGERARRADRQAQGRCRRCGEPVAHLGDRRCTRCAELEREADRKRTAEDQAAGLCTRCRQRKHAPHSLWRCEVCLAADQAATAARRARRAESLAQDLADGNVMLRQTLEYLAAEGIEPPAELVALARARGIDC